MSDELAKEQAEALAKIGLELPEQKPAVLTAKKDGIFKRILAEIKTKPPVILNAEEIENSLGSLRFGLRCMMAQGGYKSRQGIPLKDDEILKRSDVTVTLIHNVFIMLRAAEDVLKRHDLLIEYQAVVEDSQNAIKNHVPQPTGEQLQKLKETLGAMAKGKDDGKADVQGAGGNGSGAVVEESVRGDQQELAEGR
jgi:hypothetical protein